MRFMFAIHANYKIGSLEKCTLYKRSETTLKFLLILFSFIESLIFFSYVIRCRLHTCEYVYNTNLCQLSQNYKNLKTINI